MTTRDRLFEAARALFAEQGLEGLSVRAVARHAGLSTMAMYRHFADKDALVDALTQDGFSAWEAIALSLWDGEPVEWLESLLAAYLDFALNDPHRFDAAFLLPAKGARKYQDFAARRSPVITLMLDRIERAKAQGELADLPALDVALTLSALAQGLVSMQRAGRFAGPDEFRSIYAATMAGCLARFRPAVVPKS